MSVESSFFELGGNSLRAVSLARRLSSSLGRSVSVADVMRTPTASSLALLADETRRRCRERRRCASAGSHSCAGRGASGIVAACGVVESVAAADRARI